ncbi:MAG TPA: TldD/PmbA family protein [Planctomycetota bacterium]|jgi:predicted Zn-dependent protease|nr:TldD/PmbA family protein [Planctomycetota bacterium]
MLEKEEALPLAHRALEAAKADEAEVLLVSRRVEFVRFASGLPTQNGSVEEVDLAIRVRVGGREGKASVSSAEEGEIRGAAERALACARGRPPDPDLLPFPGPAAYVSKNAFAQDTARHSFTAKAAAIGSAAEVARERNLRASGLFRTAATSTTLLNSRGCAAHHASTRASFAVTSVSEDSEGWSETVHHDVARLEARAVAARAAEKAALGRVPRDLTPRRVRVILEPAAVANLLFFAGTHAFGARSVEEGASFLAGRLGERVLDPRITIEDDVFHPLHIGTPFDGEGVPTRRVALVEAGIARSVVHDRRSAARSGATSTGHALPQPNERGPLPSHLLLGGGDVTVEEMVRASKEAVLVSRIHYANLIDPRTLTITGMTRGGTFHVRDGALAYPVRNLRFTESLVGALSRVVSIGRGRELVEAFFGGDFVVPPLALEDFAFTSATSF